jgi:hypothetical protein
MKFVVPAIMFERECVGSIRCSLRRLLAIALWLCVSVATPLVSAAAQQTVASQAPRSAVVTKVASPPTVDGLLEEPIWQMAPKIGELVQRQPRTGEQPSERTEVVLLYDADNLYIGVNCYDSQPQQVIGTLMARDAALASDDRIEIVLDTYRDRRTAFYFATNPAGALVDGLVFANGQSDNNWDAIWNVRTRRTNEGWSAEFAIPFKSLGFPSGQTVWGFNIARNIQRKLEEARWSGARLEIQFLQLVEAGEITNLEGLSQGIGLDVRPFIAGRWLHTGATARDNFNGKPGLDLFYNLTPSLKMSVTANTDFGETEADARQINLSRFSLFFPEKRAFFLEDAGVFSFSNTAINAAGRVPATNSQIIPFFSRTIGLLRGEEVPIDFGVKLTGKIGRTDIGILDVRTRDIPIVAEKNFIVGRVKQNFFRQSYIGGVVTRGNPALPIDSTTVGTDLRLATSRFLGESRNLVLNAYAVRSINEGSRDRDMSYGFTAEYPNDLYTAQFFWRDVQQNFQPALGFVSRRNVRLFRAGGDYNPRPKDFLGLQQMFYGAYYTRFSRLDNGLVESWQLHFVGPIDWHWNSGDNLHGFFSPEIDYERVFTPFEIFPNVFIPVGEYRFTRWRINAASATKRKIQVSFQWIMGDYWSGDADEVTSTIAYKIPPRFNISFSTNQTFARLPQGNFVARIFSSNINYAVSPFLTFSNLVQYDNESRNLSWQSRARWILRPGNDLFVSFGQGWIREEVGERRFVAQDSKLSTKFQYTFRF